MKRICIIICILAGLVGTTSWGQTAEDTKPALSESLEKADADSAYVHDEYARAAEIYESLIARDGESAAIYYNLGNCYYRMNQIGKCVLNYERASLLDPGDEDIRANLALARGRTADKLTPASEMFFVTWWRNLVNWQSVDAWAWTGIVALVLCLLLLLVYFFLNTLWIRKVGFYGGVAALCVCLTANICAYRQHSQLLHRDTAVVMVAELPVKSSPDQASTDLFIIHEGTKLTILDSSIQGWAEVEYEDNKVGWVKLDDIETI